MFGDKHLKFTENTFNHQFFLESTYSKKIYTWCYSKPHQIIKNKYKINTPTMPSFQFYLENTLFNLFSQMKD